ncbi:MAG: metalloregulator ArsR/SmtB family transcription factor [Bacteroidota bacterium]
MPRTISTAFAPSDVELAAWAKALGHPARVAILRVLAERGTCICGEIVDDLPLAQATVSQHLKALKQAGFVQGHIDGPRSCYCLNPATLAKAQRALAVLFAGLGPDCCSSSPDSTCS